MSSERAAGPSVVPGVSELLADPRRAFALRPEQARDLLLAVSPLMTALTVAAMTPQSPPVGPTPRGAAADTFVTPAAAAARLGVPVAWIYEHADELDARRLTRRCMRIPERGLARYLAARMEQGR